MAPELGSRRKTEIGESLELIGWPAYPMGKLPPGSMRDCLKKIK